MRLVRASVPLQYFWHTVPDLGPLTMLLLGLVLFLLPLNRTRPAGPEPPLRDHNEEDEQDESGRASKKSKGADGSSSASAFASASSKSVRNLAVLSAGVAGGAPSELIDLVLLSLRNCFLYDTQHFMDKYHFTLLTPPMVQQLQFAFDTRIVRHAKGANAHAHQPFDTFVSDILTPTVVQMASRMGNYLQWKPLVSALMLHGRSPSAGVRRASVYLFVSIGDNLLVILPELLPWISELLEDADVGVERNGHRLVKIIEKLSGESLDATLNG